jgi:hypothetical protein
VRRSDTIRAKNGCLLCSPRAWVKRRCHKVVGMKGFRRASSAVLLSSLAGLLVVGLLDLDLRGGSYAEEEEKMSEARALCASQVCSLF